MQTALYEKSQQQTLERGINLDLQTEVALESLTMKLTTTLRGKPSVRSPSSYQLVAQKVTQYTYQLPSLMTFWELKTSSGGFSLSP